MECTTKRALVIKDEKDEKIDENPWV